MTVRLSSTALFTTLRAIHTSSSLSTATTQLLSQHDRSKLIISPRDALTLPSPEELQARFGSELRNSEIRVLYEDLGLERETLDQVLGVLDEGGLWGEVVALEQRTRDGGFEDEGDRSYVEDVSEEMEVIEGLGLNGADIVMH